MEYTLEVLDTIKQTLTSGLIEKLKIHHSVYRLPCTSEFLEELIANILSESGFTNDWKPNRSHSVSVDMTLETGSSFSIKSGVYDPFKGVLKFSGSRLGKHKTLEEMLSHVVSTSADYYVCVAKADQDWSSVPSQNETKTYYLFVFDKTSLNYQTDTWFKKDKKDGGFKYHMEIEGMNASIVPSLSHQLWTTVSESLIGSPTKLEIQ
jgi:hypothetical protein